MTVVETPALAGSRRRAQEIMRDLPSDLTDTEVRLISRGLLAASVSFVDEIVAEILVRRHARQILVQGATDEEFVEYLKERGAAHGVAERIQFLS